MVGVFADTGLIDRFSAGDLSSHNTATSFEPMIAFGAGGIRARATLAANAQKKANA